MIKAISLTSPPVQHVLTTERPSAKFTDRAWYWLFTDDYEASFEIDGKPLVVKIPAGFESDGASIPRVAGIMKGLALRSYFVHDMLYTNHLTSRKEADKILAAGLRFESVDESDIDLIYTGVRWFGGSHYDEY